MAAAPTPSFLNRIRDALPTLHPAERRLAEFVLDFPGQIDSYSATELAKLANVSNATVSRFIRRLGYIGYDDARRSVREEKHTGSVLFLAPAPRAEGQSVHAHIEQGQENLRRTFARVTDFEIEQIAKAMLSARKVWILGFRTSHSFATYLRWQTIQVFENVFVIPSAGETLGENLASITAQDMVIIFGLRRRPTRMPAIVEQVVKSGAKTLYVTESQAPTPARITWHIRCENAAPVSLDNHVVVMALCHLIAIQVIELAGPAGRRRLRAIEISHDALEEL